MNLINTFSEGFDTNTELETIFAISTNHELSCEEKEAQIRKQFLTILLKRNTLADRLCHLIENVKDKKANEYFQAILCEVGRLINMELDMYRLYGADLTSLIGLVNADISKKKEIELHSDENLSFGKLICKYNLGAGKYRALQISLERYFSHSETEGEEKGKGEKNGSRHQNERYRRI